MMAIEYGGTALLAVGALLWRFDRFLVATSARGLARLSGLVIAGIGLLLLLIGQILESMVVQ